MAFETVRLCDINPNPFRNMDRYPIDREKVEELKESIRTTGFWDNVVCRRVGGRVEQAYGHHRLVAAREELGEKAKIEVPIKDLDDTAMLKIMARENSETWKNSPIIDMETLRAVVLAYASGKIELGKVGKITPKDRIRYAPSFLKNEDRDVPPDPHPYTAEILTPILGWTIDKTKDVLNQLENDEREMVPEETFRRMGPEQAKVTTTEASKTYRAVKAEAKAAGKTEVKAEQEAKAAAKSVAKEVATKLRDGEISTGRAAEVGAMARQKYVKARIKEEIPLPDIDNKMVALAKWIEGFFADVKTNENYQALKEIVKFSAHAEPYAIRELGTAMEWLEGELAEFRKALGFQSGSLKKRN